MNPQLNYKVKSEPPHRLKHANYQNLPLTRNCSASKSRTRAVAKAQQDQAMMSCASGLLRQVACRPVPLYSLSRASSLASSLTSSKPHLTSPSYTQSRSLSLSSVFSPEKSVAPAGFSNRYAMILPAFLTHICIGKSSCVFH